MGSSNRCSRRCTSGSAAAGLDRTSSQQHIHRPSSSSSSSIWNQPCALLPDSSSRRASQTANDSRSSRPQVRVGSLVPAVCTLRFADAAIRHLWHVHPSAWSQHFVVSNCTRLACTSTTTATTAAAAAACAMISRAPGVCSSCTAVSHCHYRHPRTSTTSALLTWHQLLFACTCMCIVCSRSLLQFAPNFPWPTADMRPTPSHCNRTGNSTIELFYTYNWPANPAGPYCFRVWTNSSVSGSALGEITAPLNGQTDAAASFVQLTALGFEVGEFKAV
jgi:hypothetical protein